jgi:hypothetical protein
MVIVGVNALDFILVSVEQPSLQVLLKWFERSRTLINIEEDFVGQSAGNAALSELALIIEALVRVKLVGIARKAGIIADRRGAVR